MYQSGIAELAALRRRIDLGYAELGRRYRAICSEAEEVAKQREPGRGALFGRGATTWTVRQERWFQEALKVGTAREASSARALFSRLDRLMAAQERLARRLGVNEPWTPASTGWGRGHADRLLHLVQGGADPRY